MKMNFERRRGGSGRPKTNGWIQLKNNDMKATAYVCVGDVEDRDMWRSGTRVAQIVDKLEKKKSYYYMRV